MKKVVVVGGGFTGLVTSYYLMKEGCEVEIHEAGSRWGGMIGTERTPHGPVESAANGFIYTEELAELLSDIQLSHIEPIAEFKKRRFIFRDGPKRWPLSLLETISCGSKFLFRFLAHRKSLFPKKRETVFDWGLRNAGFAVSKYLLSPGLQGIYAGDARRMSAELIVAPLLRQGQKGQKRLKYRGTISFTGGMQEFIDALVAALSKNGVKMQLNSRYAIDSLETPHVVCVPAFAVADVIKSVSPESAQKCASIEMLPVLTATVFYENVAEKLEGFGCLFAEDQHFKALGVLSNTRIFENRGPDYNETWIFGGTRSPEIFKKQDLEILQLIQLERGRLFPSAIEYSEYRIHRWPQGLPHYTVELQQALDQLTLPKNLYLNGNYLGGIGLSKILARSRKLAESAALSRPFPDPNSELA